MKGQLDTTSKPCLITSSSAKKGKEEPLMLSPQTPILAKLHLKVALFFHSLLYQKRKKDYSNNKGSG